LETEAIFLLQKRSKPSEIKPWICTQTFDPNKQSGGGHFEVEIYSVFNRIENISSVSTASLDPWLRLELLAQPAALAIYQGRASQIYSILRPRFYSVKSHASEIPTAQLASPYSCPL
jgi:hypothetical protein